MNLRWAFILHYIVPIFVLGFYSFSANAQFSLVFVKAGDQKGRGFAVTRGADCYVITPKHVIKDPVPFEVITHNKRASMATRQYMSKQWDIGVLKIEKSGSICGYDSYLTTNNLSAILEKWKLAVLKVPQVDGQTASMDVKIQSWDKDTVTFSAIGAKALLHEGLSGSVLYIDNQFAGMLVSVDTTSGRGTALRVERINSVTEAFAPLFAPAAEKAKYDSQLAYDILQKNINFMEGPQFCSNLYAAGKWVTQRDRKLRYVERRYIGADEYYYVESLIIPGINSSVMFKGTQASISTDLGRVPQTVNPRPMQSRIESALSRCINMKALRREKGLRYRDGPLTLNSGAFAWDFETTGTWGISLETITVIFNPDYMSFRIYGDKH